MDKIHFRKLVNSILSKSEEEMLQADLPLNKKLLELIRANKPFRKVMLYYPVKDEPQIQPTINELLKEGPICLPRMEEDRICPVEITSLSDLELVENWGPKWGTLPTPKMTCKKVDPSTIDIIVIPGRAFDKEGVRLGRGKGHYDRFLPGMAAFKIGVCYHFQIFGKLPKEQHDITMDAIVTEKVVLERSL